MINSSSLPDCDAADEHAADVAAEDAEDDERPTFTKQLRCLLTSCKYDVARTSE